MSHELRTPLNSLLILAKLLADNQEANLTGQAGRVRQDDLRVGRRSALADQRDPRPVQGRGRQDAGRAARRRARRRRRLRRAARSARSPSRRASRSRPTSTSTCPRTIRTDPQRLQQVLKNLLANAFKFTDARLGHAARAPAQAGHALRERVAARAAASSASRSPTPASASRSDKQKLIFEAFQQADGTTSRKYGGTGLGLSISREIARLLGGEIHVESEPGKGSAFTLYLPEHHVHRRPTRRRPSSSDWVPRDAELRRASSARRRRWRSPTRS